jgi:colanic acid/amylovoran biosynthesis glycosyltransferase
MNVTFCAYDKPNYVGGPNVWLQRLLPELRRQGVEAGVLFITESLTNSPAIQFLRERGFNCPAISWSECPYTEQRVRWILERLKESLPDVFVPNLMVPAYYAGRWVTEAGLPTVGVLHGDNPFHHGLQNEFVYSNSPYRLSAVVCVSEELERQTLQQKPCGLVVRRIPCGVPLSEKVSRFDSERLRIAYVGRLVEEQKRASEVVRACCRAVEEVPDTEVVVFGDGPSREPIEKYLLERPARLHVHLAGRVGSEQIQQRLLDCHVIVLLSDYEGLPISLMEAMACGVVPVCLRIRSGIPELVEDGVTGLLVNDRADGFVNGIRRLREEPGLWQRLSCAARTRIEHQYSNEACAAQWVELFGELRRNALAPGLIKIPRSINLPPVHPDLAREDSRETPRVKALWHRSRLFAGRVKRKLLAR